MTGKTTFKLLFIAAALFLSLQATGYAQNNKSAALNANQKSESGDDFTEQEEVTRTFRLAPGASVEVSTIYGAVDIETSSTGTAEVHIIRYARNRADFSTRKINIEQTAGGLTVRGEHDTSQEPYKVRHRVTLRLPRRVSLVVEKINARVNIGEIGGSVRLARINGAVKIARASGFAEVTNINGSLAMTIANIGERGVRAEDINGSVELHLSGDLNANLNILEYNGGVSSELSGTSVIEKKRNEIYAARIGAGGVPISLARVNGGVRLFRAGLAGEP